MKWIIEKLLTRLSGKEEYCPQTWASDEKFDKLETLVKLDKLDKLDTLVKLDMVDERGSDEWSREAAELAAAAIFYKKKIISAIWQKAQYRLDLAQKFLLKCKWYIWKNICCC